MKTLGYFLLNLVLVAGALTSHRALAELKTVPFVDVDQYLGVWFEIAHKPLMFEGGTCPCAQQTLAATPDENVIRISNSCGEEGQKQNIRGVATNKSGSTSKFKVAFEGDLLSRSYWIIGLDPRYRFAVVSDRWSYSLHILARTPTLSPELYAQAVALAAKQVDVSALVPTPQDSCTY